MPEHKPYEQADKAIIRLNRRAIRRFNAGRQKLSVLKFDELSVLREIRAIYEDLDKDNRREFLDLFLRRYKEVNVDYEDTLEEIAEMYLANLLESPHPLTHYVYETEVLRKRDRTEEAVNSVEGARDKRFEMEKGLRFWSQMTAWYVDAVSDGATLEAFKAMGIRYVQWHTAPDDRVCADCHAIDGEVFDIDNIPDKPHLNCRCYLTPVKR